MNQDFVSRRRSVSQLMRDNKLDAARDLLLTLEQEAANEVDEVQKARKLFDVSRQLNDLGARIKDKELIQHAIQHLNDCMGIDALESGNLNFCLGTSHQELLKLKASEAIRYQDTEDLRLARHYFRLATSQINESSSEEYWASASWTNYGNLLIDTGRVFESVSAYDHALGMKSDLSEAFAGKGRAVCLMGDKMPHYRSALYSEAEQLLHQAIHHGGLTQEAREGYLKGVRALAAANESSPLVSQKSTEGIKPADAVQNKLFQFIAENDLWLSPYSAIASIANRYVGDSFFFSGIPADLPNEEKLIRYISFLNEIKNEYVLGRYFLFQSQSLSPAIDAVAVGVEFYKTYDHANYSAYVQLLKAALKQAVAVLDKVAFFLFDYCNLEANPSYKVKENVVSFLRLWENSLTGGRLPCAFMGYENAHLFALFTLARDLYSQGDWQSVMNDRHKVTHRFLILHDEQADFQPNADIPRKQIAQFRANALHATQIARAATMYLVQFVEEDVRNYARNNPNGFVSAIGFPF